MGAVGVMVVAAVEAVIPATSAHAAAAPQETRVRADEAQEAIARAQAQKIAATL